MLGDNHRLRERLLEHGARADAEVLEVKERPWVTRKPGAIGAFGTYRLKLQVNALGQPAFEAELTDQWRDMGEPAVGERVPVLYDPDHPSKLVLDDKPGRYRLADPLRGAPATTFDDPELAVLSELDNGLGATPSGPSQLEQLAQLADLRDRGVLSDDEFAAQKAKILSEG
jgi:hypothetical protein